MTEEKQKGIAQRATKIVMEMLDRMHSK
jgi:hypothetical protein